MDLTANGIRRMVPEWIRNCAPPALRRWVAERLCAPANAPLLGVAQWMAPPVRRTATKRALVSYLTAPFRLREDDPDRWNFSPFGLARSIVRALNEMGYVADVVDWTDRKFRPRRRYDLYVGHGGHNTLRLMEALGREPVKILHLSGARLTCFHKRLKARFDDVERRRGVRLPYYPNVSQPDEEEALRTADAVILLGNECVAKTYAGEENLHHLNNAACAVAEDPIAGKDFGEARRSFLFFAGNGNVLKGLDLLLEAFSRCDARLHICQAIEPAFRGAYQRELEELPNVHVVGWVPMRSPAFHSLVGRCAWNILPSCSEGQPGSVIECMHHGLIPVVSRECNISTEDFGVTLEDCSLEEVARTVTDLSRRPPEWCAEQARRTRRAAMEKFSEEAFVANFKETVRRILLRAGS